MYKYRLKHDTLPSIIEIERTRARNRITIFNERFPKAKYFLIGFTVFAAFKGLKSIYQIGVCNSEIDRRKEQLKKPIYNLEGEEKTDFPWTKGNLKEWLHRPVKITGRPLHYKQILIPRTVNGAKGFDNILPVVTKEDEKYQNQEGVLVNKGWIPHEYYDISNRFKLEEATTQTFVGYVSKNSELEHKFLAKGNNVGEDQGYHNTDYHDKWHDLYLPSAAESTPFLNKNKVKFALIECADLNTQLNERDIKHYDFDCDLKQDYPYKKTMAGALQLEEMPWDSKRKSLRYFKAATFTGVCSFLLFAAA